MRNLLFIFFCLALSIDAQELKKIALVIGNSDYKTLSKLPNPDGDARLIAETLDSIGFEVMLETNIKTRTDFGKKISEFSSRRESFDVGFIFYAGHGMQINGKNYLLPTEEEFNNEEEVEFNSIGAELLIKHLLLLLVFNCSSVIDVGLPMFINTHEYEKPSYTNVSHSVQT